MRTLSLVQHVGRCVVRFPRERTHAAGTGFFVGPGLVLTCAHVLGDQAMVGQAVQANWAGRPYAGKVKALTVRPYPDLALVRHFLFGVPRWREPC